MENEFNFDVLKQRIQEEEDKQNFYFFGIEMLMQKYEASRYFELDDLKKVHPDISEEFLKGFLSDTFPTEEAKKLSVDELDQFVQTSITLIGMGLGVFFLQSNYPKDEVEGYVGFLYSCRDNDELSHVLSAFASLSLAMETPPSFGLLQRFAPLVKGERRDEIHATTLTLIAELNADLIARYVASAYPGYEGRIAPSKSHIPDREGT